jgi:hypothetical protein
MAQMATLLMCIQDAIDSKSGWNNEYPEAFRAFPQSFQTKEGHNRFVPHPFHYALPIVETNGNLRRTCH